MAFWLLPTAQELLLLTCTCHSTCVLHVGLIWGRRAAARELGH